MYMQMIDLQCNPFLLLTRLAALPEHTAAGFSENFPTKASAVTMKGVPFHQVGTGGRHVT